MLQNLFDDGCVVSGDIFDCCWVVLDFVNSIGGHGVGGWGGGGGCNKKGCFANLANVSENVDENNYYSEVWLRTGIGALFQTTCIPKTFNIKRLDSFCSL